MNFSKDESAALQSVVDFIKKTRFSNIDGVDALNLFPTCRLVLQAKAKIDSNIREVDEKTMKEMAAKASKADAPKNPKKGG